MSIIGDELLGAPLASSAVVVLLKDFEPAVTDGLIGNGVVDFLHVDGARTLMTYVNGAWLGSVRPECSQQSASRN